MRQAMDPKQVCVAGGPIKDKVEDSHTPGDSTSEHPRSQDGTQLDLIHLPLGGDDWAQWSAPASDGSPLVMRDRSTQEIYALDLQLPMI